VAALLWAASYTAWADIDLLHAAAVDNPIRLQGQYADAETGLSYNRHRYFCPHAGQFISQDPLGLSAGIHPYQMAPSSLGWLDPLGLSCTVGKKLQKNADEAAESEVTVYRVFGGDARAQGFSWTTIDPRTVKNFRDVAGLPSGGASGAINSADFLVQGKVNPVNIIKSRAALPLDGNKGGLPELIIDPKNVNLTDFSVLNP
jgi:RHS repeat-associated protein